MKILVIGALPRSLINFRGDFIRALVAAGHDVHAAACNATQQEMVAIEHLGAFYRDYSVQRNGLNPFSDLNTLVALRRLIDELHPDIVFSYTIKPVIWGGLAAKFSSRKPRFIALITGLGYAFDESSLKRKMLNAAVVRLYRLALKGAQAVIFQNSENRDVFLDRKIISSRTNSQVVAGSGVNLEHFTFSQLDTNKKKVLFIARLLGDKGIREFVAAARLVKQRMPNVCFDVVGPTDPSPDAIHENELRLWRAEGVVNFHGEATDVRPFLNDCTVFVLPSYHEGMPRTVLEAMATGRPIITTDAPGCRGTTFSGLNGILVPVKSIEPLANAMIVILTSPDVALDMGKKSRELAERHFCVHKINEQLLNIVVGAQ